MPSQRSSALAVLLLSLAGSDVTAFQTAQQHSRPTSALSAQSNDQITRKQWMTTAFGLVTAATTMPQAAFSQTSITKCNTASKAPCVSTANVKNLEFYLPPWTYGDDVSADQVMAKLKAAILAADTTADIQQQEGSAYLRVQNKRNDLFQTVDETEFAINDVDKVVTFRASTINSEKTDFGLNKKRLTEIRKRAGIFGIMGEGMNSADSVSQNARGNGPLGQLKAFYGLQSGAGFEDVVLDKY